jgi:DNA invertase Pin-like site-specific DNA recombinase
MTDKITSFHLERSAIVYVRQSSSRQLRQNHESRRLQYAMKNKLVGMGWPAAKVEVIDDDLGVTASGAARRKGFERLLSQVTLGRVGIVAAREVSRFARNDPDWQRLLEVCRQVNTILLDHETVYDIRNASDRLMIGIKGNISGYELDLFRARSYDALQEKARRGELVIRVPTGYVKIDGPHIEKTPDARVHEAVDLIFAKFLELGSALRVTRWFEQSGLKIPTEVPSCRDGTRIKWIPPRRGQMARFLKNPIYAGAYAYGRSRVVRVDTESGARDRRVRLRDPAQWKYIIKGHHEGYIDFETFEKIQRMLDNNRQCFVSARGTGGAAKNGTGLLCGLIRCGYCGRLMNVTYSTQNKLANYVCRTVAIGAQRLCRFRFTGTQPEAMVVQAALLSLEPLGVAAAERAFEVESAAVDDQERALERECEQARYEAGRAERQYDAIEPENRLVAATLERRWNETLVHVAESEASLAEHRARRQRRKRSRVEFLAMARRFPDVWNAPRPTFP